MKQIAILGRNHALGVAELSVRLNGAIKPLKPGYVALDGHLQNPESYGSIVRLVEPLETVKKLDWQQLLHTVEQQITSTPPDETGKIKLAITPGDLKVSNKHIQADLLSLKKRLKAQGYSIRLIMPKNGQINAAQVKANKLAAPGNYEITPIQTTTGYIVARTSWCQDVDTYAARDYDRPMRDGFVGMLPPKLTQIMLNLSGLEPADSPTVLDPFCGTGVVLQEAQLMGFNAYGTDVSDKMVEYSQKNLEWLADQYELGATYRVEHGDARSHNWQAPINGVVCETYLGEPQTSIPSEPMLKKLRSDSANLLSAFLRNLHEQIEPGTPVVLAIPAWKTKKGTFIDSPVVDSINRLGYTRTKLEHISASDLIYFRPDQYVARRLLVLTRQ